MSWGRGARRAPFPFPSSSSSYLLPARRQKPGERHRRLIPGRLAQREHAQAAAQELDGLRLPVADQGCRAADDRAPGEGRPAQGRVARGEHGPEQGEGLERLAEAHLRREGRGGGSACGPPASLLPSPLSTYVVRQQHAAPPKPFEPRDAVEAELDALALVRAQPPREHRVHLDDRRPALRVRRRGPQGERLTGGRARVVVEGGGEVERGGRLERGNGLVGAPGDEQVPLHELALERLERKGGWGSRQGGGKREGARRPPPSLFASPATPRAPPARATRTRPAARPPRPPRTGRARAARGTR